MYGCYKRSLGLDQYACNQLPAMVKHGYMHVYINHSLEYHRARVTLNRTSDRTDGRQFTENLFRFCLIFCKVPSRLCMHSERANYCVWTLRY